MTRKPLGDDPYIHEDCLIVGSTLGKFTEVGRGSRVLNSQFGDYSYCERLCDIANARIAKFSNIASFVRIGPTDHPMDRASQHHFSIDRATTGRTGRMTTAFWPIGNRARPLSAMTHGLAMRPSSSRTSPLVMARSLRRMPS